MKKASLVIESLLVIVITRVCFIMWSSSGEEGFCTPEYLNQPANGMNVIVT